MSFTPSKLLALVACILFVLAAVGFSLGRLAIVDVGLAFLAAAFVV